MSSSRPAPNKLSPSSVDSPSSVLPPEVTWPNPGNGDQRRHLHDLQGWPWCRTLRSHDGQWLLGTCQAPCEVNPSPTYLSSFNPRHPRLLFLLHPLSPFSSAVNSTCKAQFRLCASFHLPQDHPHQSPLVVAPGHCNSLLLAPPNHSQPAARIPLNNLELFMSLSCL